VRLVSGSNDIETPSKQPSGRVSCEFGTTLVTTMGLELYQRRAWIQIVDARLVGNEIVADPHKRCSGTSSPYRWRSFGC
jgi:hypothetical protein